MSRIQGRFYFKLTPSGNLLGEYSNNRCLRNFPESASRVTEGAIVEGYEGNYISTWCEDAGTNSFLADLSIAPKENCTNIFSVRWMLRPADFVPASHGFVGEAMLADDMLVGNYQMVPASSVA